MDIQTLIAMLIVAAAALYMGRRLVRTLRGARADALDAGCGHGGCGCEPAGASPEGSAEMRKGASRPG